MLATLKEILGRLSRPKAPTRKLVYRTAALVLGLLAAWGVVSADDAAQLEEVGRNLAEQYDKLLGVLAALLADRHVSPDDDKE